MKTNLRNKPRRQRGLLATALITLAVPGAIYATVQGTGLNIGVSGSTANLYTTAQSAVVGMVNRASYWSLAVGGYNLAHNDSIAVGHNNDALNLSAAVGNANSVNEIAAEYPRCSMAVGYFNTILGNHAFAAGRENTVEADNAAALGHGLTSTADAATVVGSYNVDKEGLRFAVGTGTGPTSNGRANAFEVYANGDIVMKPQGDISMGEFQ